MIIPNLALVWHKHVLIFPSLKLTSFHEISNGNHHFLPKKKQMTTADSQYNVGTGADDPISTVKKDCYLNDHGSLMTQEIQPMP